MGQFASPRLLAGQLILIAEDEAIIAFDAEEALRRRGADVLVALDLESAMLATAGAGLTAAILDCRLGQRTVEPVCVRLDLLGVPFLFATGDSAGIDGRWDHVPVLSKPIAEDDLIDTLTRVLVEGECGKDRLPANILQIHRCVLLAEERIRRQRQLVGKLKRDSGDLGAAEELLNVMIDAAEMMRDHRRMLARERWMRDDTI